MSFFHKHSSTLLANLILILNQTRKACNNLICNFFFTENAIFLVSDNLSKKIFFNHLKIKNPKFFVDKKLIFK